MELLYALLRKLVCQEEEPTKYESFEVIYIYADFCVQYLALALGHQ